MAKDSVSCGIHSALELWWGALCTCSGGLLLFVLEAHINLLWGSASSKGGSEPDEIKHMASSFSGGLLFSYGCDSSSPVAWGFLVGGGS